MFVFFLLYTFSLAEESERELTAEDDEFNPEEYGYDLVYEYDDFPERDFSDDELFQHYHPEFDEEQRKLYGFEHENPDDLINEELKQVEKDFSKNLNHDLNADSEDEAEEEQVPETLDSKIHQQMIDKHKKMMDIGAEERNKEFLERTSKRQEELEKRRALLAQHEKEMEEMLSQKKKFRLENPPLPLSLDPKQGYLSHSFQIIAHLGNFNNDGCKCRFNGTIIVQGYEFEGDGCSCMVPAYKKPGIILVEVAEYDELNWINMGTIKIVRKPIFRNTLVILLIAVIILYVYVTIRQRMTSVRRRRKYDDYNPLSNQYL